MSGFRDFVEHLDPCFKMPTRKTVKETGLRDMYTVVNGKIKDVLKTISHLNISVDGWSDPILRSFNGYTVQGIDNEWNLINIPIGFQHVEGKCIKF